MLKATVTSQDSMKINEHKGVCMILAGAGMCNAGRILHHLNRNLWREEHVLIVGFQGHGSLGRQLVDGHPRVTIHGVQVIVRAHIHTLGGFSAHAGQKDLLHWLSPTAPSKPHVVLTHGEDDERKILDGQVQKRFGLKISMPRMGRSSNFRDHCFDVSQRMPMLILAQRDLVEV